MFWIRVLSICISIVLAQNVGAAQHKVKVEFTTAHGELGCHFSLVLGKDDILPPWAKTIIDAAVEAEVGASPQKILDVFTRDHLIKFIMRDDDNKKPVTNSSPLNATVNNIQGNPNSKFVFDISDFRKNPGGMHLKITVDDRVEFEANGNDSKIRKWNIIKQGAVVNLSNGGDRELLIHLP